MTSRIVSEISYPTIAGVGGNYSNDDRTITGESFNFGGDTTVTNCDVFLTTASPQDDVTLTFDSDITVTGQNGNLMFGAMMQAPVMDVATVSSVATIQSGVTFAAGCVIQTHFFSSNLKWVNSDNSSSFTRFDQTYNGSYITADGFKTTINNCKTGSKLLITVSLTVGCDGDQSQPSFRLYDNTNSAVMGTEGTDGLFGTSLFGENDAREHVQNVAYTLLYTPSSFSSGSCEIELYGKTLAGNRGATSNIIWLNRAAGTDQYNHTSSIAIQEIAG